MADSHHTMAQAFRTTATAAMAVFALCQPARADANAGDVEPPRRLTADRQVHQAGRGIAKRLQPPHHFPVGPPHFRVAHPDGNGSDRGGISGLYPVGVGPARGRRAVQKHVFASVGRLDVAFKDEVASRCLHVEKKLLVVLPEHERFFPAENPNPGEFVVVVRQKQRRAFQPAQFHGAVHRNGLCPGYGFSHVSPVTVLSIVPSSSDHPIGLVVVLIDFGHLGHAVPRPAEQRLPLGGHGGDHLGGRAALAPL